MKTKKHLILIVFLLLITKTTLSQSNNKYNIIKSEKGKFSLIDKETGDIVNKYKKCDAIELIENLKYPTNEKYKDFLIIRKGKMFILFDVSKEKEVAVIQLNSEYSISIYEIKPEDNEVLLGRINVNLQRNYLHIFLKGKNESTSLLYNLDSKRFISTLSSWVSYEILKENLILVSRNERSMIIDEKGKIIVPFFTKPFFKHFNGGVAFTNDNWKFGVVNYQGDTVAPFIYKSAQASINDDFVILVNSDNKAGVLNANGKIIIPFIYKPKHPNYYRAYSYSDYGVFMLYKSSFEDSSFVFVDTNGTELIKEGTYQNVGKLSIQYESNYNNRYYFVQNGKYGVFDTKQKKEIIPCKYNFFKNKEDTQFGVISASDEKGNWGLLNLENGLTIIPFEYESIKAKFIYTIDSVATYILSREGKFGIINYRGVTQLPFEYSNISKTNYQNLLIIEKDGRYGLFDIRTSNFVIPVELKTLTKYLKLEKMKNSKLIKGRFNVENNQIEWEE